MTKLLKKDNKFEWSEDCNLAMKKLTTALTTAPILQPLRRWDIVEEKLSKRLEKFHKIPFRFA
jgi:hypothetical protein